MKKNVGRPKKEDKADKKVSSYLSEDDYEKVLKVIEEEKRSMSQYINFLITQDLQKKGY